MSILVLMIGSLLVVAKGRSNAAPADPIQNSYQSTGLTVTSQRGCYTNSVLAYTQCDTTSDPNTGDDVVSNYSVCGDVSNPLSHKCTNEIGWSSGQIINCNTCAVAAPATPVCSDNPTANYAGTCTYTGCSASAGGTGTKTCNKTAGATCTGNATYTWPTPQACPACDSTSATDYPTCAPSTCSSGKIQNSCSKKDSCSGVSPITVATTDSCPACTYSAISSGQCTSATTCSPTAGGPQTVNWSCPKSDARTYCVGGSTATVSQSCRECTESDLFTCGSWSTDCGASGKTRTCTRKSVSTGNPNCMLPASQTDSDTTNDFGLTTQACAACDSTSTTDYPDCPESGKTCSGGKVQKSCTKRAGCMGASPITITTADSCPACAYYQPPSSNCTEGTTCNPALVAPQSVNWTCSKNDTKTYCVGGATSAIPQSCRQCAEADLWTCDSSWSACSDGKKTRHCTKKTGLPASDLRK